MCKYQCCWIWIQLPNGDEIFTIFDGNFWWLKWKCTTLLADWVAELSAISITCNDVTKMHLHTNFKFCNEFWCDCTHHCIHNGYLYQTIECNFVCLILVKSMPHTPTHTHTYTKAAHRLICIKTPPNHQRQSILQRTLLNERLNQFCITLISIWSRLILMDFTLKWIVHDCISQDLFALLWHKAHLFHDLVFDSSQIFATTKTFPSLLDTYQIEISIYMRAIPVEHPSIVQKHNFRPFAWNRLCLWFNMKIFLFMPHRNNTNNSMESFDENILIKITWTTSFYVVYNSPETNQREHQVECESTFFRLLLSISISFRNGYC